jgi:hypothetical protein
MSPLTTVKLLSYGRLAIGVAGVVAPQTWNGWVGKVAEQPEAQTLIRGFGARDAFIGALTLHVADRKGVGARTVGAVALLDCVDLASTLASRRALPSAGVFGASLVAGGAAAAGLWASREL